MINSRSDTIFDKIHLRLQTTMNSYSYVDSDNESYVSYHNQSVFRFADYVFPILSAMGATAFYIRNKVGKIGKPTNVQFPTNYDSDRYGSTALKLRSPEVKKFSGINNEWPEWKTSTSTTLLATGYGDIIDEGYDGSEPEKNKVVYAMLANATVGGRAHWLVMEHMKDMDGNMAWTQLHQWYEGTSIQSEIATSLRNQIHGAALIPGVSATQYINLFMQPYNKLGLIKGSSMSEAEAKDIFLENITDPEFKSLKEYLSTSLDTRTLRDLIVEIQKKELALNRRADLKRRVRRQALAHEILVEEPPTKRARRMGSEDAKCTLLPKVIKPNLDGIIYIRPSETWKSLCADHKQFVTSYNSAVRHSDPLPAPPSGVTIGEPTDDGKGNGDVAYYKGRTSKVRRVRRTKDISGDIRHIESAPIMPSGTRKVSFHLGNTDVVDDDPVLTQTSRTIRRLRTPADDYQTNPPLDDEIQPDEVSSDDLYSYVTDPSILAALPPLDIAIKQEDLSDPIEYQLPELVANDGPAYHTRSRTRINNNNSVEFYTVTPRRFTCKRAVSTSTTDRFVCDTGGGKRPTITERAWTIIGGETGLTAKLSPYQSDRVFEHPVVSAVTKATIANLDQPVLLKVHYATYISNKHDANEVESLMTTMDIGNHGIKIEGVHPNDSKCGITVNGKFLQFDWDEDTIFFSISKPTEEELGHYDIYELNSPTPTTEIGMARRLPNQKWESGFQSIPMNELKKRFAYLPDEVIQKTLDNTTQFYLDVEENRSNPQRHFRKRFKAITDFRQNEEVATDFVYFSTKSSQGHKGGQFFVGVTSKRWAFYPLHKESQNSEALQDYVRSRGAPRSIISDNAKSEIGHKWVEILRDFRINSRTSEPHHPHQNPSESEWGRLGNMMKNVLRQSKAPIELCQWVAMYCCQINDHTSRRSLKYKTPLEVALGWTPDISQFRFYFYEPVWYFEPKIKLPKNNLIKARYLAVAESCGDAMTYYILTEPDNPKEKRQVLMRSVIKSRRKDIGTETEYVNENPDMESFTLSLAENDITVQESGSEHLEVPLLVPGEKLSNTPDENNNTLEASPDSDVEILPMNDPHENLPPEFNITNDAESFQALVETSNHNLDGDCTFRKILNHSWNEGTLIMKAQYTDTNHGNFEIDTPFKKLKMDEPLACAKYIKEYIPEQRRGDRPLNEWATHTIEGNVHLIRRMMRVDPDWRSRFEDEHTDLIRAAHSYNLKQQLLIHRIRRNGPSRNQRLLAKTFREKFGIPIPNTIAEALHLDRIAGNSKWADAIAKEMGNLDRLKVFRYHPPSYIFPLDEGWQKAPLRMIFDIKNEDHRYKARLVVGGHKVDATGYNTFSSQVDGMSVLLLFLIAHHLGYQIWTSDVSNAFVTAPNSEKVWATAGDEFGEKKGCKVELQRALYGLPGSARAFADFLADTLTRLGFTPSRADPDLWIKRNEDGIYNFIATHVDDLIIVSKNPEEYLSLIEQEFALRNTEANPSYYLGAKLKLLPNGKFLMNMEEYIKEVIRRYEAKHNITLKKENIPMPVDAKPEMDDTDFLSVEKHKQFQHVIGVGQWIVLRGRIDITYAISSLSRFSSSPREGHLLLAHKIFGYLKKFPKKGIVMDPTPPIITEYPDAPTEKFQEFGHQYQDFKEELDPKFPEPTITELDINIFCDADHAHDLVTGRSVTGIIAFVGSAPIYWKSTRQTSVQTSTFGSEFTALKKAVEVAITIRYHLRSMGVKVTKPTKIFVDNKSVCINSSNPASTLNKKAIALAYHFVREHQAAGIVEIHYIKSEDNYADCLTKALNSTKLRTLQHEFMTN